MLFRWSNNELLPNAAGFSYTDGVAPVVTQYSAKRTRPLTYTQATRIYNNGGARNRFVTDAATVIIKVYYSGLMTDAANLNSIGAVYVNSVFSTTFTTGAGAGVANEVSVTIANGSVASRTYDVVMPFSDACEFVGVVIPKTASLSAAAARPTTKLLCFGDSITEGFRATDVRTSWAFQLANAKNYQLLNMAAGSQITGASPAANGAAIGGLAPTYITILIGFNDYNVGTSTASYISSYTLMVNAIRAVLPTTKIYAISLLWTNVVGPGPTDAQYRTALSNYVSGAGDSNLIFVNGLPLATNNVSSFPDGIHPNDTGSGEISTALQAIIP